LSRIGKKPIALPSDVDVKVSGSTVVVKGPKGSLVQDISPEVGVVINVEAKEITLTIPEGSGLGAKWGLYRMLINNMIEGVSKGFKKTLEIEGVGYRAEMKGSYLMISAGYSHPVLYKAPAGIVLAVETATKVSVSGIDKQVVGQVAAEIRSVRKPEPYKGKGIRYEGERIMRKAGKTGSK